MMLRSEHDRRGGDDRIIVNGRGQDKLTSSRRHRARHPMKALYSSKSKEKKAEGDEDD